MDQSNGIRNQSSNVSSEGVVLEGQLMQAKMAMVKDCTTAQRPDNESTQVDENNYGQLNTRSIHGCSNLQGHPIFKKEVLLEAADCVNGLHAWSHMHPSSKGMGLWDLQTFKDRSINSIHYKNGATLFCGSTENDHEHACETPSKRRRLLNSDPQQPLDTICTSKQRVPNLIGNIVFPEFLEWLRRLALSPGDPKKGQGPKGSKQDEIWVDSCVTMATKIRTVLWERKDLVLYGYLPKNSAKHKIPPALYYKELPKPDRQTIGKLRANQSRAVKCGIYACDSDLSAQSLNSKWVFETSDGHCPEVPADYLSDYSRSLNEALLLGYLLNHKATRKRIPIGPHFQAQIPVWTGAAGKTSQSGNCPVSISTIDYDNLQCMPQVGILTWPIESSTSTEYKGKIGSGRFLSCSCADPMSIECVRSHVMSEREKLKSDLGEAFDSLGFNDMGETVAERWTKDEETRFELIVRMNPYSMERNFWEHLPAAFPSKSLTELVSYYFNVFVLRRRALENRRMPESVDSDDDERELQGGKHYIDNQTTLPGQLVLNKSFANNFGLKADAALLSFGSGHPFGSS